MTFSKGPFRSEPPRPDDCYKPISQPKKNELKESQFPESVLSAPGLLQAIADYTNRNCFKLQPQLSFAGAFSALAYFLGRRVMSETGIRTNVYCLAASGAGTGKDAARRTNKKLITIYDSMSVDAETYESRQAFVNHLIVRRQLFCQLDEFGQYFAAMNSERANPNVRQILDEWLRVYTSAGEDNYLPRVCAADAAKAYERYIVQPHFTLYATTTPAELFKAITPDSIKKGFIPRCFVFEGDNHASFLDRQGAPEPIPESIAEVVRAWHEFNKPSPNPAAVPCPFVVPSSPAAQIVFSRYIREVNEYHDKIVEDDALAIINSRAIEKTYKAALIFAASRVGPDADNLRIEEDDAVRSVDMVKWCTGRFILWKEKYLAESQTDKDIKDILEWVYLRNGVFSRSEFTRRFQRLPKRQREELLETIIEAGYLSRDNKNTSGVGRKGEYYNQEGLQDNGQCTET